MNCYWLIGQIGIVIEVLGAGILVYSAFKTKKRIEGHRTDLDNIEHAVQQLMSEAQGQVRMHSWGFAMLVIGLAMQFIGGFGK